MSFRRLAAFAGLTAFVLYVAAFALQGAPPGADAPLAEVSEYLGKNQGAHQTTTVLWSFHAILGVLLLVGLYVHLREREPGEQKEWSVVFLFGAVLFAATTTILTLAYGVLFYRPAAFGDQVIRMLWDVGSATLALVGGSFALASGGAAVVSLRWKAFPAWYGWLSSLAAVVGLVALLDAASPSLTGGVLALILGVMLGVWVLASSVALLRSRSVEEELALVLKDEAPLTSTGG